MSGMNPLVCYSCFLTILFTVMFSGAETGQCVDNFASCSTLNDVCNDPFASLHICRFYCNKCEQHEDPPCQNNMDTFLCEQQPNCADSLYVTLCPCKCVLVTSPTSTVTASSTIVSTTSTSAYTRTYTSTHTSTYEISTTTETATTVPQTSTIITEPTTVTTMDTQMSSTPATTNPKHLTPSACNQCGNLDGDLPCTDEQTLLAESSPCNDDTPYCMNDIIQTDGHMNMYKRCVNETICNAEWYMESSDKQQCTQFDPAIYTDDLICHLCCYGDDCNVDNVPQAATLYKP